MGDIGGVVVGWRGGLGAICDDDEGSGFGADEERPSDLNDASCVLPLDGCAIKGVATSCASGFRAVTARLDVSGAVDEGRGGGDPEEDHCYQDGYEE